MLGTSQNRAIKNNTIYEWIFVGVVFKVFKIMEIKTVMYKQNKTQYINFVINKHFIKQRQPTKLLIKVCEKRETTVRLDAF